MLGITAVLSLVFGIIGLAKVGQQPGKGKGLAVTGIVLSAAWTIVLIVLVAIGVNHSQSHPERPATAGGRTVDVFRLRPGDCFHNPTAQEDATGVTFVTVVPCSTPHNAQVFVEFTVAGGSSYPGKTSIDRRAARGCDARVSGNLDKSKITSTMSLRFLYPRQLSWLEGHRTITCLVVDSRGNLTTSVLLPHPAG